MKHFAKSLANVLAATIVLPLVLAFWGSAKAVGRERAFPGFSQFVSLAPGLTGVFLRRAFYRMTIARCDSNACVSFGVVFSHPGISIGDTVYIGTNCMIGDVELCDDVLVGSNVSIINGNRQHGIERLDIPVREQPGEYPRIVIGRDTWIGDKATVMANVGKHCIVGAASVVTKPISDYAIVVGNPARVIGWRNKPSNSPIRNEAQIDGPQPQRDPADQS